MNFTEFFEKYRTCPICKEPCNLSICFDTTEEAGVDFRFESDSISGDFTSVFILDGKHKIIRLAELNEKFDGISFTNFFSYVQTLHKTEEHFYQATSSSNTGGLTDQQIHLDIEIFHFDEFPRVASICPDSTRIRWQKGWLNGQSQTTFLDHYIPACEFDLSSKEAFKSCCEKLRMLS